MGQNILMLQSRGDLLTMCYSLFTVMQPGHFTSILPRAAQITLYSMAVPPYKPEICVEQLTCTMCRRTQNIISNQIMSYYASVPCA